MSEDIGLGLDALQRAGYTREQSLILTGEAIRDRVNYGLLGGERVPRMPGRINQKTPSLRMNQRLIIDPAFDRTAERLPAIAWLSSAGQPLPPSLSEWCEQVMSEGEAVALLDGDAWEEWSGDRDNAVGAALSERHPKRYQEWNLIVRRAKEVLSPHEEAIRSGLDRAGLAASRAIDVVKWDVVGALTCAAYQDCRIPSDELRLLDIYQAGHVPVGFDSERQRVLVF